MLELRRFVISAAPTTIAKVAGGPWSSIVLRQVYTTVIPWVAVCVETSGRLDGDQGGFGDIARAILEERASWRMRAVLTTVQE